MKKYVILGVIIISSLIVGGCSLAKNETKNNDDSIVRTVTPPEESAEVESTTTQSTEPLISYQGQTGQTALQLLQAAHKVGIKETSFGPMIESIDGVANTREQYWMLYVNGTQATVGADAYNTKDGEKIEWRYETLKF